MELFKNASTTWLPLGKLGPFPLLGDDGKKRRRKNLPDVQVVHCTPSDILNIQGSSVLRFEPEELIFTSKNISRSSRATISAFLHASYPWNLTFPKSDCQVYNRTNEEHANVMLQRQRLLLPSTENNTTDDKNNEWKLVSHFGPLTSKYRPRGNSSTNVFICKATKKGLKVEPSRFVWNSTNYTQAIYVPHYVHSSYPDDQPIPPPKCHFRRDVNIPTTATAAAADSNSISSNSETLLTDSDTLQLVGMVMLLITVAILSLIYVFPNKQGRQRSNGNSSVDVDDDGEEEDHDDSKQKKTKSMPLHMTRKHKSMPLTFSQKLAKKGRGDLLVLSNPGRKDGSWTIVEGPGSRNLMIQWVDDESFVTKLVPKTDQQ